MSDIKFMIVCTRNYGSRPFFHQHIKHSVQFLIMYYFYSHESNSPYIITATQNW